MTRASPQLLRVIQVTDCHIPADPVTPYRGHNADRNLSSLLPVIRRWQPDLLLLTGDVAEDGSATAYGRVSAQLSTVGAPVLALPGNHDDPEVMRRYFPLGPWDGPFVHRARGWRIVMLDSTAPGQISGIFSAAALHSLDQCLLRHSGGPTLLALHHQPVAVDSPWIDAYALEDAGAFWAVVDRHHHVRCVSWGHVHQAFHLRRGTVDLFGSPSTAANGLPGRDSFTLDLGGPACRWLELAPDGGVETGLLRAGS